MTRDQKNPMPEMRLEPDVVIELAEAFSFIHHWLGGHDQQQLAASFARFVGVDGYILDDLRTDLARFTFLLGYDDGEHLFSSEPTPSNDQ